MIEFWVSSDRNTMVSSVEDLCKKAQVREQKQRKKYTATLKQLSTFEVLLGEVYVELHPKPSEYDVRRDLVRIFNEIAKEIYGWSGDAPVVEAFGSFSMDLFSAKSDLDLSVNFTNGMVSLPRGKKIQALGKFAKKFYQLQRKGFVHGVNPVTTARVPVLKVVDRGTEIECDMSVENWDGISKSKIIYMIGAIDERFRKLSFLMKAWAKAQNINSAKDQTLNSLSIILLVAFHLQTRNPPILPPFSALFGDGNEPVAVERSVCKFSNHGISNKESVAELFFSLLTKLLSVEKLWAGGLCASTFEGSWISKTWGSRAGRINVEDFADRSQNVARAVGAQEVKRIYSCIQLSVQHIFDFLNKKIGGNSLREFLFGRDVASKLATAGTVDVIAKEIHACSSGKEELQSIKCPKGNKVKVQACPSGKKEVQSVECSNGNKQTKQACASGKEELQSVGCSEGNKKIVQASASGNKEVKSVECSKGDKKIVQACASETKEVKSVECSRGDTNLIHVDSIVTKSTSYVESQGGMPQGKRKLSGPSLPTGSSLTKRTRTDDCLRGNLSRLSGSQPGEGFFRQELHYLENRSEPVINRGMISREGVYNTTPPVSFEPAYGRMRYAEPSGDFHSGEIPTPVSFEPTYGRMRYAEPFGDVHGGAIPAPVSFEHTYGGMRYAESFGGVQGGEIPTPVSFEPTYGRMRYAEPFREVHGGEIVRHPHLMAPAAVHDFPSRPLVGSQISYEPFRYPLAYSNSVRDSMQSSPYFPPPDHRRF